jgi:hypothetical protein
VHQLVFTLFSSLPFAVGQPQDVGLIFLSSMATGVAEIGREVGMNSAEIVGTALLTLTVATFVVGLLTSLVGEESFGGGTSGVAGSGREGGRCCGLMSGSGREGGRCCGLMSGKLPQEQWGRLWTCTGDEMHSNLPTL